MTTPSVIYCAKSTEDKHESIPGQLADCRTRATDEGWTVVGEYSDEGFSAYSASRSPGLIAAREHAAGAAAEHGTVAMLLCQHSGRISRGAGDKPGATDALVEIWHQERRRNVWLRSVDADDDDLRTTKGAASIGDRNHKDSKRKSAATRAGLQRRKERGEPVGRIPLGYGAEASIEDGKAVTRRVIDPVGAAVIRQMFDLVEEGFTFGDVSRRFNDAGRARDQRRAQLDNEGRAGVRVQRGIRGRQGLPGHHRRRELAAHRRGLRRLDPEVVQRRRGGRRAETPYLLRRVSFCARCGSPMWTRDLARVPGRRASPTYAARPDCAMRRPCRPRSWTRGCWA